MCYILIMMANKVAFQFLAPHGLISQYVYMYLPCLAWLWIFLQGKMLDLIFVVDDAELWHAENLGKNHHHYSFLRHFGSEMITKIQRTSGRVYYNTLVEIDSQVPLQLV